MRKQPIIVSFGVLILVFALACGGSTASKEQAGDARKAEMPPSPFAQGIASTPPHALVGTVTLCPSKDSCVPAADGEVVTAWMEGIDDPVAEAAVTEGKYHLKIVQRNGQAYFGRTVTFKIGDEEAHQSHTWVSGAADVVDLVTGEEGARLGSNQPQGSTKGITPPSGQGPQVVADALGQRSLFSGVGDADHRKAAISLL